MKGLALNSSGLSFLSGRVLPPWSLQDKKGILLYFLNL